MNAKQATFLVLDGADNDTTFSGNELKSIVEFNLNGGKPYDKEHHYPDTFLRYMREYRKKTGRRIECINKRKSLYKIL